ncbi:unnamed protein product [Sphenostylis stenocarpa]|uniref:Uncharacterized protein n=1 Tax=Sphenostylis stenocarpa TaxID=92480 RepID=A0AA86S3Q5_9FABA|nr:unnamed protein product [Sphenostylis stenocarpa]
MGNRGVSKLLLLFFFFFFSTNLVPSALAIWLTLPASGTKCVSEEIQHNVVVLADYVIIPTDHSHNPTIAVKFSKFPGICLWSRNGLVVCPRECNCQAVKARFELKNPQ